VTAAAPSITLHSSWRHLIGSALGAGIVATAGTYAVGVTGFGVVATLVFVLGWGLVGVVLLDVPVAVTFDPNGVVRRMMLRRQRLEWRDGDELTRVRPSAVRLGRSLQHGGLALRRGRRRYLLVDRAESAAEFDELERLLSTPGEPCAVIDVAALPRPSETVPPTWLYRRRVWRPDSAAGR
jgi:hypothetical protein